MTIGLGRIVRYVLTENDTVRIRRRRTTTESIRVRLADMGEPRWPAGAQAHIGTDPEPGESYAMMIVRVHADGTVNGQVFLDGTDVLWVVNVLSDANDVPGTWRLPRDDNES